MTYPIKCYKSTQTGAPVLNGTVGSLIAVLDACLLNGFNLKTLDSLVCAGGIATATVSNGHGYREGEIVLISGANQTEYNGEQKIHHVTATTFQFDVTGTPASPATGTLTAKIVPLNWVKPYESTNIACYRSSDPAATGLFLRVDDTVAKYASVAGFEAMTDASTGTGRFPLSGTIYWEKSNNADNTPREWTLVGDGRTFYLFAAFHSGYSGGYAGYLFGDINSYKSGDAYHCALIGNYGQPSSYPGHYNYFNSFSQSNAKALARTFNQIGSAVAFSQLSLSLSVTYPSAVDNGMLLAPVYLIESNAMRGVMPGLLLPLHPESALPVHGTVINDIPDYPGREFMVAVAMVSTSNTRIVIDLTGPWH